MLRSVDSGHHRVSDPVLGKHLPRCSSHAAWTSLDGNQADGNSTWEIVLSDLNELTGCRRLRMSKETLLYQSTPEHAEFKDRSAPCNFVRSYSVTLHIMVCTRQKAYQQREEVREKSSRELPVLL